MACVACFAFASPLAAQDCDARWLAGEGLPGVDGTVEAMVVIPPGHANAGDVIVAGWFTVAGNVAGHNIARYSPETHTWNALGAGVTGSDPWDIGIIYALALLPNGDLVVGGNFAFAGGLAANNIARYSFGTDSWSALGSGVAGPLLIDRAYVNALAVMHNGDVVAGGWFGYADGAPVANFARYSFTTQTWSAFGPGSPQAVHAMVTLPNGDLIVGGHFDEFGGIEAGGVAHYHAATGSWSDASPGQLSYVSGLALLPNGDVVACGFLGPADLARYSPASNTWTMMDPGPLGRSLEIYGVAALPNGDVVFGGHARSFDGSVTRDTLRYHAASQTYSSLGEGTNDSVYALAALPDGDVLVGGRFTSAGESDESNLARWSPASNSWSPPSAGTNASVYQVLALQSGDLLVAGNFTTIAGVAADHLARYVPSTGTWSAAGSGFSGSWVSIYDMAVISGGDVIIAGHFTEAGGAAANHIAHYSPESNTLVPLSGGVAGENVSVHSLATLHDGTVIVGGSFTTAGGITANNVARYDPTNDTWSGFGVGADHSVDSLAVLPNGDVIAGGWFTNVNGVAVNTIARLNPSTGVWTPLATPPIERLKSVRAFEILPDGNVLVAGIFSTADQGDWGFLARYNPTTDTWSQNTAVTTGGFVADLLALSDGDVIVCGTFGTVGGVRARHIARYSPDSNECSTLGAGISGNPQTTRAASMALLPDGDLIVGGDFTFADGDVSAYLARYDFGGTGPDCDACPACVADFDQDGGVTGGDLAAFIAAFELDAPCADVDHNGGVDGGDLGAFFAAFEAGGC